MEAVELKKELRIGGEIERVDGRELTYTQFVERYLVKNQPVVLTGLMDDWRASRDWVNSNGSPNLRFFATHFGKSQVQVADCGSREFTDQKRVEMSVSEFIAHWLDSHAQDRCDSSKDLCNKSLFYLKDWHFVREYPDYVAYATPFFFKDDWLNLYLDKYPMHCDGDIQERNEISCSDYRFVYMGRKGCWNSCNNIFLVHGPLCMLMFSDLIVGQPMLVAQNYGFFYLLPSIILSLTGT
ncbi:Arginine-specific demethylase jmj20 [Dionaea muscipula]